MNEWRGIKSRAIDTCDSEAYLKQFLPFENNSTISKRKGEGTNLTISRKEAKMLDSKNNGLLSPSTWKKGIIITRNVVRFRSKTLSFFRHPSSPRLIPTEGSPFVLIHPLYSHLGNPVKDSGYLILIGRIIEDKEAADDDVSGHPAG